MSYRITIQTMVIIINRHTEFSIGVYSFLHAVFPVVCSSVFHSSVHRLLLLWLTVKIILPPSKRCVCVYVCVCVWGGGGGGGVCGRGGGGGGGRGMGYSKRRELAPRLHNVRKRHFMWGRLWMIYNKNDLNRIILIWRKLFVRNFIILISKTYILLFVFARVRYCNSGYLLTQGLLHSASK